MHFLNAHTCWSLFFLQSSRSLLEQVTSPAMAATTSNPSSIMRERSIHPSTERALFFPSAMFSTLYLASRKKLKPSKNVGSANER